MYRPCRCLDRFGEVVGVLAFLVQVVVVGVRQVLHVFDREQLKPRRAVWPQREDPSTGLELCVYHSPLMCTPVYRSSDTPNLRRLNRFGEFPPISPPSGEDIMQRIACITFLLNLKKKIKEKV